MSNAPSVGLEEARPRPRPEPRASSQSHLRDAAATLVPPLLVYALANLVLWVAAMQQRLDYWAPSTRSRWDSAWYFEIAERGTHLVRCASAPGRPLDAWCGSAGWFPGYPALIWVLDRFGLQSDLAGTLISEAFVLLLLVLIWKGFLLSTPAFSGHLSRLLALLLAGFWFGQVFYHAVFPMAPCAFFLLLALLCLRRRWWLRAGLAGAAAATLYPSGVFVALAAAIWICLPFTRLSWRSRLSGLSLGAGLPAAGLFAVLAYQRYATGHWTAYLDAKASYGVGVNLPWDSLAWHVHFWLRWGLRDLMAAPAGQALLVAALTLVALLTLPLLWRKDVELGTLLAAALLVYWLSPLVLGRLSLYRADSLLLPGAILLGRLPAPVVAIVLAAAVALSYATGVLFFANLLA